MERMFVEGAVFLFIGIHAKRSIFINTKTNMQIRHLNFWISLAKVLGFLTVKPKNNTFYWIICWLEVFF
jgi:hypothetical protein